MTVLESNNRHAATNRKNLEQIKTLTADLSGWEFSQEKDGVKLYSKAVEGSSIPLVRGDYLLKTTEYTAEQVAVVATLPGARSIWDEKFHSSEVKEMFTQWESFFWVRLNTPWPISNRDFVGCNLRDMSRDLCYISMASVQDDTVGAVSGCVRGNLICSGWKLQKVDEGIQITYVTQVDLAGSIPSSFLRNVQLQVPLCAGKVADYISNYGFPPVTGELSCTFVKESFDHAKREHTVQLDGQGDATWTFSSKMYPNGVKVNTSSGQVNISGTTIQLSAINGPTTVTISKA
ncbi:uncharacterized protein BX664DRAFT_378237 [Halteromyces radiatus]|uniref:uncharacterized protein n=1 Tax=Halteromyces radiatus TaxID=101107 RepID=UPI00221EF027|nr:uncharacterized protein BX664DRAFT_378237 [Halteromyces radiatus]KAI8097452.1 hypothetical protein BX664DRAFT_378237 [Halteromyces radiatus]